MEFEFDKNKSQSNKEKHGIDLLEAQQLWQDNSLLEFPSHQSNEPRFINIGMIGKLYWTAIITYRDENVRIISVRRSRKREVDLYENFD